MAFSAAELNALKRKKNERALLNLQKSRNNKKLTVDERAKIDDEIIRLQKELGR